jgi:hypothetical protein
MKNLYILFILLFQYDSALANFESAESITRSFDAYVSLNKRFIDSLGASDSKELRSQLETYSEVDLTTSLSAAERLVCDKNNFDVVKSLLSLLLNTMNSANEHPSQVLGEMFICQPDLVMAAYKGLPKNKKSQLSKLFSFGFENAAYNKHDTEKMEKLRSALKFLLSGK